MIPGTYSDEKKQRALVVAQELCNHGRWKAHSHGISRTVAWDELKIKICHPEDVPGLLRAIRRLWALLYWVFETTNLVKVMISSNYGLFRGQQKAPNGR